MIILYVHAAHLCLCSSMSDCVSSNHARAKKVYHAWEKDPLTRWYIRTQEPLLRDSNALHHQWWPACHSHRQEENSVHPLHSLHCSGWWKSAAERRSHSVTETHSAECESFWTMYFYLRRKPQHNTIQHNTTQWHTQPLYLQGLQCICWTGVLWSVVFIRVSTVDLIVFYTKSSNCKKEFQTEALHVLSYIAKQMRNNTHSRSGLRNKRCMESEALLWSGFKLRWDSSAFLTDYFSLMKVACNTSVHFFYGQCLISQQL